MRRRSRMPARMVGSLLGGLWLTLASGASQGQQPLQPQQPQNQKPKASLQAPAGNLGQVRPPSPAELFRVESEALLRQRLRREARQGPMPRELVFPAEPATRPEPFICRSWEPKAAFSEPAYVCYGRLYFEQINAERYGWDLGIFHPLLSAGIFYFDVVTFPYHWGTDPFCKCECSAGYCLPGDCVPFLWAPAPLSASGAAAEALAAGLVVAALVF